jgi:hypothetical protein
MKISLKCIRLAKVALFRDTVGLAARTFKPPLLKRSDSLP